MSSLFKVFSSFVTMLALLFLYASALAAATFIEKYHGVVVAKSLVYHSPLFFFLQFLLVVNFIVSTIKHNYLKRGKWGLIMTHLAFIVILSGALTSYLFSEEGIMHLRQGEKSDRISVRTSNQTTEFRTLPFSIELEKFTLTRYPGSMSPSSYESEVIVHIEGQKRRERIFMNNVLDLNSYRFFQASYDPDEQGTILSVNHDVAGRNITYAGYFLMFVGLLLSLLGRDSRFRALGQKLKKLHPNANTISLLLLLGVSLPLSSAEANGISVSTERSAAFLKEMVLKHTIDATHAEKFGSLPLQAVNGRMMPVNTFSSEILRKLHKSDKIFTLSSDQFLISLLAMPDIWAEVPFITYSNEEIAETYGLSLERCAYSEAFDEKGVYKLQHRLEEAYHKQPSERTRFDKDIMKLDERLNLFNQLISGQRLALFPEENSPNYKWYAPGDDLSCFHGKDSMFVSRIFDWYVDEVRGGLQGGHWEKADEIVGMIATYQQAKSRGVDISANKLKAELRYNKLEIFRYCKMGYLILGGILLMFSLGMLLQKKRWMQFVSGISGIGVLVVFHYQMIGMGLRWYIAGYAPWSNSYETMVYVSWATVFAGLLFVRRSVVTFALATLFAGVILFVSGLNWMDPEINPLVPVLKSPWLMFHVAIIVASYGFLGISSLIGIVNLLLMCVPRKKTLQLLKLRIIELSIVNEMSLWIGLVLLIMGTFLGAIWANESWGRYWGWDPKETWALVTIIVYVMVTHLHLVKKCDSLWIFNLSSVFAFASVLMTFFGVNYLLSGMHSYGQNDKIQEISAYLYIVPGILFLLSVFSYIGWVTMYKKQNINHLN